MEDNNKEQEQIVNDLPEDVEEEFSILEEAELYECNACEMFN